MEDEKQENPEGSTPSPPPEAGGSPKRTLKQATSLLKAEALRRYRDKHRRSLDRHEKDLEEEFGKSGRRSKKPSSPGLDTPDIAEDEGDDVFYPTTESLTKTPVVEGNEDGFEADDGQLPGDVEADDDQLPGDVEADDGQLPGDVGADDGQLPGDVGADDGQLPGDVGADDGQLPGDVGADQGSKHSGSHLAQSSGDVDLADHAISKDSPAQNEAPIPEHGHGVDLMENQHPGKEANEESQGDSRLGSMPGHQSPAQSTSQGDDGDKKSLYPVGNAKGSPRALVQSADPNRSTPREISSADQPGEDRITSPLHSPADQNSHDKMDSPMPGSSRVSSAGGSAVPANYVLSRNFGGVARNIGRVAKATFELDLLAFDEGDYDSEMDHSDKTAAEVQGQATDGQTAADESREQTTYEGQAADQGQGQTADRDQGQTADQGPDELTTKADDNVADGTEQSEKEQKDTEPTKQPDDLKPDGEGQSEEQSKAEDDMVFGPTSPNPDDDTGLKDADNKDGDTDVKDDAKETEPDKSVPESDAADKTTVDDAQGDATVDEQNDKSDAGQTTGDTDKVRVGETGVTPGEQQAEVTPGEQQQDQAEVTSGEQQQGQSEVIPGDQQQDQAEVTSGDQQGTAETQPDQQGQSTDAAVAEDGQQVAAPDNEGEDEDHKKGKKSPADGLDPDTRGDEDEIMSEASHQDDGVPKIPDDHYYNYENFVSKPSITEDSGLPADLLSLHHSFGYDCHKRSNLQILDEKTAMFAAGNVVELLNLHTKEQTYIRTTSGGGIGAIAVHPSKKYFAIAEKGSAPNINIFEYPSLRLYRVLRGGTEKSYAYVDFSPDGKLLASVGGDPDFMLTLWEWKQELVMLRSKAFSQDVHRVTFSAELEGQLTSAGTGHIRFWKKAYTFTGLKLQGQLGKFGKKEISDIEGYVELPDGKVLSGSESGNLLLWDGGLIKVEICRKNKKPCHIGSISQVIMDEGELMTIGIDGFIRVWDFETIDTADVTDEADLFEMDPMNELRVGGDVQLKSIVKSVDPEEPTMWYAQDANGGIWKLDLSFSFTSNEPERVMSYHAGSIIGCDTAPNNHLAATIGIDHTVRVYDYTSKTTLSMAKFNQPGSSILWVPQVVDPKGSTVLAGFADGVVRVFNFQKREETQHRKHKEISELALKQAFKPHNGAVTAMAIDSKGETLATGGSDNTIFFLSTGDNYEPIGFMKTPSAVTHLEWTPAAFKNSSLLVCCVEGQVLEIQAPEEGNFDTSHSYEISGLKIRSHDFKSIKSRLRHEEELARRAEELEAKKKQEAEERRIRIERGLETDSDHGDNDAEKGEEEEEWSPYIPQEPSPILFGCHGKDPGKSWLSMGDFDAGYLYEIEMLDDVDKAKLSEDKRNEPTRTVGLHNSNDMAVHSIKFSASGKYLLMGMEDGSVRIQPLRDDDIGLMGPYWSINVHDNNYGKITHLSTSYDDKYLFTVGEDGNFFVFELMEEGKIEEKVAAAKAKIPSAKKELAEKKIDDIEDPKAYSIEDAKQKSEHDKMIRLAEEKKAGVKTTITHLRDQFKKLLSKNQELPTHLRLDRKEFEMDPEIKRQLQKKTQEKIDLVEREMAWEAEKHRVALEKLRARFKAVVECERIVLKSFQSEHEVCSYRASKLSDEFYLAKAMMEKRKTTMMSREEASRQATQDLLAAQRQASELQGHSQGDREASDAKIMTTLKGSMGERINKSLAKVEEKKRKRAVRRSQWEELNSTKPDDDFEDPADIAAIKEAKENMGDYKLKSASDYVVPDHLRMNAEKARARLIILKELIHKHRYDFNEKLLALRDKKIHIIDDIRTLVGRLQQVQIRLGPDHSLPLPSIPRLHSVEMPEKRYEYTRETLVKFRDELALKKEQAAKGTQPTGDFGGFGAQASNKSISPAHSSTGKPGSVVMTDKKSIDLLMTKEEEELSPLEKQLLEEQHIRLIYDRDHLLRTISELQANFDAELRCLRHDKFKMDISLKNADLRHVTLFEELLLLKDFEKQENVLAEKVENKQQEKLDMQAKVIEIQQKLEGKKKDIEKQQEKEKSLHATFIGSLGENNKFADYLTKVFKKKIKRSKKKANEGDGSDEDSDEDSDDESDWSESEEESDSEAGGFDLDVCPPGCDQALYDQTCAMREKRLDIEEDLVEEKKNKEIMNKELEALQKRAKIIDVGLHNAELELEAFQLEKQQKLNELDVVVTLKLHQIQHVINGVLPHDLSQCLVFESTGVVRLQHRIKELEQEKSMQKRQQKDAKKTHVQLIKDRRVFEQRITGMDDQCNKMMLQKFGRIVDLEKLEMVTVNRQLEELKEKLRLHETACANELITWDDKIYGGKDRITEQIRENTNRLDQLNMLLGEKKDYEKELDSRQKNLGSEFSGARKSDVHERQRLIQLVHLQAQEIEALKEEIMLLSRKGGHILPPAQPPMPGSAQSRSMANT